MKTRYCVVSVAEPNPGTWIRDICRGERENLLDRRIEPFILQVCTLFSVVARVVARSSQWNRCNEPPSNGAVEAGPFPLRRPARVSGEALAAGLVGRRRSAAAAGQEEQGRDNTGQHCVRGCVRVGLPMEEDGGLSFEWAEGVYNNWFKPGNLLLTSGAWITSAV